jgi:hypothetical protein
MLLLQVSTLLPELMELTVGLLHKECILTVPLAFVLKDEGSGAELTPGQYRRLMRYKELEDPDKPGVCVGGGASQVCLVVLRPAWGRRFSTCPAVAIGTGSENNVSRTGTLLAIAPADINFMSNGWDPSQQAHVSFPLEPCAHRLPCV